MNIRIIALLILGLFLLPLDAQAKAQKTQDDPNAVTGLWLTENKRAAIDIQLCEDSLCGYVAWIIDGGLQFDKNNPDESKWNLPICGLKVLGDFTFDGQTFWEDGYIYDAKEGDTYTANISVKRNGNLRLRGYIGLPMFGKSQEWTRLTDDHPRCAVPKL